MTPFKFSLERVRQLRERAEKEAALNLARAQVAERAAHEETATAEARAQRASEALSAQPGQVTRIGDLRPIAMLRDRLGAAAVEAAQEHVHAQAHVDDGQRTLGTAMQARRILDRLREKKLGDWKVDADREELAVMDEVARTRALHDDSNRRA